jgi:hypothetical protein
MVSAAKDARATREGLLERVFPIGSAPMLNSKHELDNVRRRRRKRRRNKV